MMSELAARARFLFRSDEGTIDASTWRRHTAWLVALLVVMSVVWRLLRRYTHHDLATEAFLAPLTIIAFVYLVFYAFAIMLVAISYTLLSMKRFRDRGEPVGLAALVPLFALFSGSLHFLYEQTPDAFSGWYVVGVDVALALIVLGTIYDLGFRKGRVAL